MKLMMMVMLAALHLIGMFIAWSEDSSPFINGLDGEEDISLSLGQ
jgi:hypothetical protein